MRHSRRNVKIKSDGDTLMGSDVYSSVSGDVDKSLVECGYMEQPCAVQP